MFLAYGLLWGLIAVFFPPADLIAMFVLGTWPLGLVAIGLLGLGSVSESRKVALAGCAGPATPRGIHELIGRAERG